MQSHSIAGFLEPIQVRISNLYLYLLRIQLKLNTALLSTVHVSVRVSVRHRRDISHFSFRLAFFTAFAIASIFPSSRYSQSLSSSAKV